ncbi:DUF4334 domain-containing protein [Streptomyces sp. TRM66268-LWL]|uniref:DUF4334 domain-containing protein n=1 Tax=Streptomyces polyasparticus TaxID=2767826 RepID=A0ABR7SB38_9ACTN|nr:DUF4334 domain-containing protein [Streptomyces polyasparticus]MBC9712653.1 DUF4334 domain-containing protein [Streptomyces polyasparticus]
MDNTEARALFARIRAAGEYVDPDELDAIWAQLECVRPEEILGSWRGSEFDTGHVMNGQLDSVEWYGKTFVSLLDVKPLMCRDGDGVLYSHVELGKGEASLWSVEFRGETTATMVYDGQPVFDHFKKVDDDTLMGIMNGKGVLDQGRHFYFSLDRD